MNDFNIHQLFDDIINDNIINGSRTIKTNFGIEFLFSWNSLDRIRETFIHVLKSESKSFYPNWKGIELVITNSLVRAGTKLDGSYVVLRQVSEYDEDGKKYETIIGDLFSALYLESIINANQIIKKTLNTWKEFFHENDDKKPSAEEQQGLFGELLFLKYLINTMGISVVESWQGPSKSDHDFAISENNAVEVKTTNKKAPYEVKISNEYQLDISLGRHLVLVVYPLERNYVEGKSVPQLIKEIENLIESDFIILNKFKKCLLDAHYHDAYAERYDLKFVLRENQLMYHVQDSFPRINRCRQNIPSAVGSISYTLSLGNLNEFLLTEDEFKKLIMVI